jgi:hypothetical protein
MQSGSEDGRLGVGAEDLCIAEIISPSVARARAASMIGGIRLPRRRRRVSARRGRLDRGAVAAGAGRRQRSTCLRSSAGSIRRIGVAVFVLLGEVVDADDDPPALVKFALESEAASAISRWGKLQRIASTMPPSSSMRAK